MGLNVFGKLLTVDDAISSLQKTVDKLKDVIGVRDNAITENTAKVADLQREVAEHQSEKERAQAILEKLTNLLS